MKLRAYLDQNFRSEVPEWLDQFDPQSPAEVSELIRSFLHSPVVFYPGSGQDGSAVQIFNEANAAHCFLYVDYMMTRDAVEHELRHHGFKGYMSIAHMAVTESEIGAGNWTPHLRPDEVKYRFKPAQPYAFLEILEKRGEVEVTGGHRLAIMFLAADGHAAYDALFCQQNSAQAPFGLIAQDHGYGGNWSDFGGGGAMETVAKRTGVFPTVMLVGDNTQPWEGYVRCENVDAVHIAGMRTRSMYIRA